MQLAVTCGLPLSGKSTLCVRLQRDGWTIVCPDNVRMALHGQQFVTTAEPIIWATIEIMVRALLKSGNSVLIDATNTTKERRKPWIRMAKEFEIPFKIFRVNTSYEECIRRNSVIHRLDQSIIDRQHAQFEEPTEDEGEVVVVK